MTMSTLATLIEVYGKRFNTMVWACQQILINFFWLAFVFAVSNARGFVSAPCFAQAQDVLATRCSRPLIVNGRGNTGVFDPHRVYMNCRSKRGAAASVHTRFFRFGDALLCLFHRSFLARRYFLCLLVLLARSIRFHCGWASNGPAFAARLLSVFCL